MNSIIICEGLTDCLFIQYYMRNVIGQINLKEKIRYLNGVEN